MTSRPAGFTSPFEGRSRRSSFSQIPVEPEPSHDDDGLPPVVARSRTPWLAELMPSGTVSNLHEAEQAKSPFAGSVTESFGTGRRRGSVLLQKETAAVACDPGLTSMSSAPVETLSMKAVDPARPARPSCGFRLGAYVCDAIYPRRGRTAVPPDVTFFLLMLGGITGLLGIGMDDAIDFLAELRLELLDWSVRRIVGTSGLRAAAAGASDAALTLGIGEGDHKGFIDRDQPRLRCADYESRGERRACVGVHAAAWVGFSLALCWLAILLTALLAPQAAGSGIPEMKSILSGGMKTSSRSYLSLRTLCAKVIGLVLALGGGLPLGKEGPFVHIACCLSTAMLEHLPCFDQIRRSKPLRLQMLAVGCAAGVSSTFGAPSTPRAPPPPPDSPSPAPPPPPPPLPPCLLLLFLLHLLMPA
jgi:hypothetical protein